MSRIASVLTLTAVAALLGGCVVRPVLPHEIVVPLPPPPPRVEVVPVAPGVGWLWIDGYWGWAGGRHVWRPGHWSPPRQGQRYEPHRWEPAGNGWRERGGRWGDDRVR